MEAEEEENQVLLTTLGAFLAADKTKQNRCVFEYFCFGSVCFCFRHFTFWPNRTLDGLSKAREGGGLLVVEAEVEVGATRWRSWRRRLELRVRAAGAARGEAAAAAAMESMCVTLRSRWRRWRGCTRSVRSPAPLAGSSWSGSARFFPTLSQSRSKSGFRTAG